MIEKGNDLSSLFGELPDMHSGKSYRAQKRTRHQESSILNVSHQPAVTYDINTDIDTESVVRVHSLVC